MQNAAPVETLERRGFPQEPGKVSMNHQRNPRSEKASEQIRPTHYNVIRTASPCRKQLALKNRDHGSGRTPIRANDGRSRIKVANIDPPARPPPGKIPMAICRIVCD